MMGLSKGQKQYVNEVQRVLAHFSSQTEVLELVAKKIAASLESGGVVHAFGSGHSHSFAEELFHRAGGLVPVNALLEEALMPHAGPTQVGPLERLSGLAQVIAGKYDLRSGEVLILASNSGINAVTVELAEKAKALGLFTVGVTSLTHSKGVPSRASKKLFEVVDAVLDTGTPVGDACVDVAGSDLRVAPLSGVASSIIGELLVVRVAELFSEMGQVAPVYQSANTVGGDQRNKNLEEKYRARVRCLR